MLDVKKQRCRLEKSSVKALDELDKIIKAKLDANEIDPEKLKITADGKLAAVKAYNEIINIVQKQQELNEENERNSKEGSEEGGSFDGVEGFIK